MKTPIEKVHNIISDHEEIGELQIDKLKKAYEAEPYLPLKKRKQQLNALKRLMKENHIELCEALFQDLGKPYNETILTEINLVIGEINFAKSHLKSWIKNKYVALPYMLWPATGKTKAVPKGVVLIMSPWNYPYLLLLSPLVGALASGNRTVLKTSPMCPETSKLLCKLIPQYLDNDIVQIYNGHRDVIQKLLDQKFDHIFFTGGGKLGDIVYKSAAKFNTPVTLEMGGKSPVYIDESVNLKTTADRIAWGKMINAGQTCVAPDYVIIKQGLEQKFISKLEQSISKRFNYDLASDKNPKIVDHDHFNRVSKYLDQGTIVIGGKTNPSTRFIEPTVILNPNLNDSVMKEEIFGPILPIITVKDEVEALEVIKKVCETPLACYIFSNRRAVKQFFESHIRAGIIDYKIAVGHLLSSRIPFGGFGSSGIGKYHGKYSFETFSHRMPILNKPLFPDTLQLVYPTYSKFKDFLIKFVSHIYK
jgi:aldehyde dehydrogenase (NAD+)